jgi:3-dehydroquinate synthase
VNNVVLVGFMGSGKSTVGPHLARRMDRPFVDLDDVIETDAGRSVAEIFSSEGEAGFREREARCLQHALERSGSVVAVGGGAPMRDDNWMRIRDGNCVVALMAEPDELARRLNGSTDRPMLQSGAPSVIASLLPRRLSRYLEADLVVKTDGLDPAQVAEQVKGRLSGGGLQRILIDVPGSPHDDTVGYGLTHLVAAALGKLNPFPARERPDGISPKIPSPVYGGGQGGGVSPKIPSPVYGGGQGGGVSPKSPSPVDEKEQGGGVSPKFPSPVYGGGQGGGVPPKFPSPRGEKEQGGGVSPKIPSPVDEKEQGGGVSPKIPSPVYGGGQGGGVLIVTDAAVAERHADPLLEALASDGITARLHLVPPGESAKELDVLAGIYESLADAGVDRRGVLIALGGGSVGDVAGFAAATWMRGIRYMQMPTTLLAMVDSSIGGKTAINLPAGKNMAGAVHQPSAIFCDLDYLASLPDEEYRGALAEVIKAALIAEPPFAEWLSANLPAVLSRDPSSVREAVARAIAIKAAVVARDPQETGERAILNYGHTVGHALERVVGFGRLRHGQAVAWGMEVAARISLLAGACTPEAVAAQHALLHDAGLLVERPSVAHAKLMDAMRHDKKSQSGEPRWVLLRGVGQAEYGQRIDPSTVRTALDEVLPE